MKKTTSALLFAFTAAFAFAQEQVIKCYTHEHTQQLIQNDPSLQEQYQNYEEHIKSLAENASQVKQEGTQSVLKVVPVVFHVIHEGGSENISRAQMLDMLRIINEDFKRLNADTIDTPAPFAAVAADCEIEFRIAQKDPNGNCTDGVVRVYSPLTNNADDNTKLLSTWPNTKYLNVWVVKSIDNGGGPGTILGYAQFPGFGNPATDGVIIRHDCIGSIGTALTGPFPFEMGRTAT